MAEIFTNLQTADDECERGTYSSLRHNENKANLTIWDIGTGNFHAGLVLPKHSVLLLLFRGFFDLQFFFVQRIHELERRVWVQWIVLRFFAPLFSSVFLHASWTVRGPVMFLDEKNPAYLSNLMLRRVSRALGTVFVFTCFGKAIFSSCTKALSGGFLPFVDSFFANGNSDNESAMDFSWPFDFDFGVFGDLVRNLGGDRGSSNGCNRAVVNRNLTFFRRTESVKLICGCLEVASMVEDATRENKNFRKPSGADSDLFTVVGLNFSVTHGIVSRNFLQQLSVQIAFFHCFHKS